MYRATLVPR